MSEGGTLKLDTSKLSIVSVSAKVFVGGFPPTLRELHVEEILNCFGKTKYFNLVRNKDGVSQGYGYAEWEDSTIVDYACAALNNIELGNHALTVRRADSSPPQVGLDLIMAAAEEAGIDLTRTSHGDGSKGAQDFVNESNVICLLQMVTRDDLLDDAEYKDILEDIRDECSAFGKVVSIEIPRPTDQYSDPVPGEGKVFVEFATINEALKAKNALQGRKFASRIVVAQCFNYNRYKQRDFV
jgi:splicing factor U2AF subunit